MNGSILFGLDRPSVIDRFSQQIKHAAHGVPVRWLIDTPRTLHLPAADHNVVSLTLGWKETREKADGHRQVSVTQKPPPASGGKHTLSHCAALAAGHITN